MMINEEEAENFGYDCGKNGANPTNCNFRIFATKELTAAWERGKAKAGATYNRAADSTTRVK